MNQSSMVTSRGTTVPALVVGQAIERPNHPAVIEVTRTVSYRSLVEASERIRSRLRGVIEGSGGCVAIRLPRGADFIASALAVMSEGAAYLPLDPTLPSEPTLAMLADAKPAALISRAALTPVGQSLPLIDLDDDRPVQVADGRPVTRSVPQGLAYVIYTSGSQGRPKGVEVEHHSLLNLISWHIRAYAVGPSDRALHTSGLSFDAAVWEIWPYLAGGAAIVVTPEDTRRSARRILSFAQRMKVSIAFLATPLAEEVLVGGDATPQWRFLLTGGDRLRVRNLPHEYTVVNHYGPTEAAVVSTRAVLGESDLGGYPPIGRPITGVKVLVCDDGLNPVAVGETGEILIGGKGVARGYRNRPELTERKFLRLAGRGGRWYRTGDLGRWRKDGQLDFIGRMDSEQLKVRGLRVEASDIEAALLHHPNVRSAAVGLVGSGSSAQLVALIVFNNERTTLRQMRSHLYRFLPPSLFPNKLLIVEELPLTASGKLDRSAIGRLLDCTSDCRSGFRLDMNKPRP